MRHLLLIALILARSILGATCPYYLSICAIFQNEANYLQEWIEYHRIVGVEHFYLYNNHSKDHYLEVLRPYLDEGIVTLINWPCPSTPIAAYRQGQCDAYADCFQRVEGETYWVAVVDIDEFIVPKETSDIPTFLKEYEEHAAVVIQWQVFGTSGYDDLPPGKLLTEALQFKLPVWHDRNMFVKSIVRPGIVSQMTEHYPTKIRPGHICVSIDKCRFHGNWHRCHDRIQINHYWFRTWNWFVTEKAARYGRWFPEPHWNKDQNVYLPLLKEANSTLDTEIQRFIPELRRRLGLLSEIPPQRRVHDFSSIRR